MSANFMGLHAIRFDARVTCGGCLININGETHDCNIEIDKTNFTYPRYSVLVNGKEITYFHPSHVYRVGDVMFQLAGCGRSHGDATLIVPTHGLLDDDDEDENE